MDLENKRILAFCIDLLIFSICLCAFYKFSSIIGSHALLALTKLIIDKVQFISYRFISLFVSIPTIYLLISYILCSASLGQYLLGVRLVQKNPLRPITIKPLIIKSITFLPSLIPFCGIPFILSLTQNNRQSPIDRILKIFWYRDYNLKPLPKKTKMAAYIISIFLIYPSFTLLYKIAAKTNWSNKGVYIGGSMLDRAKLRATRMNIKGIKNNTVKELFANLRYTLKNKDKEYLLLSLTLASRAMVTMMEKKEGNIFSGLPEDIKLIKSKTIKPNKLVRVTYVEREGNTLSSKENHLFFTKEQGEWRIDLLEYLIKQIKSQEFNY